MWAPNWCQLWDESCRELICEDFIHSLRIIVILFSVPPAQPALSPAWNGACAHPYDMSTAHQWNHIERDHCIVRKIAHIRLQPSNAVQVWASQSDLQNFQGNVYKFTFPACSSKASNKYILYNKKVNRAYMNIDAALKFTWLGRTTKFAGLVFACWPHKYPSRQG